MVFGGAGGGGLARVGPTAVDAETGGDSREAACHTSRSPVSTRPSRSERESVCGEGRYEAATGKEKERAQLDERLRRENERLNPLKNELERSVCSIMCVCFRWVGAVRWSEEGGRE
eukprot:937077-Rhodomonas_salina.1